MYQSAKELARKGCNKVAVVAGGVTVMAGQAQAALPAEATAAFTTLSGSVTDVLAAVWPILAAVTGGFAIMKLFKKGTGRAV